MRISDWSSDVCSSDLRPSVPPGSPSRPDTRRSAKGVWVAQMHRETRRLETSQSPRARRRFCRLPQTDRSEEHTSELQSLMRISYAVFCLKKKKTHLTHKANMYEVLLLRHKKSRYLIVRCIVIV